MNAVPHIPVYRLGRDYESLEQNELTDFRGDQCVARVSQANAGLIRRDLKAIDRAFDTLQGQTTRAMIDVCARAGNLFMEAELPVDAVTAQGPVEYVAALSDSCGLPRALCRANMVKIQHVMAHMDDVLDGLTRRIEFDVLDRGIGELGGQPIGFCPTTHSLGVVLPSNSPGVNSLWLPAVALRIPVILKPGREDPWTPWRIIQSFLAAGCPPEAFGFYPTSHEGSDAVLAGCGRAILFGDQSTVERYASRPSVSVHGPGFSKILIGEDMADGWESFIDVLADSVALNSGRSCVNASTIVAPRHAEAIARALAERLATIQPLPLDADGAKLAGFVRREVAEWTTQQIDQALAGNGAKDISESIRGGPRMVDAGGVTYLLPTVVHCRDSGHALAKSEFLFPFASVVEIPQPEMLDWIGPTLVATAITEDSAFQTALIRCSEIDRLNLGAIPTPVVRWDQPHEGNLFEFLYRRRAIQRGGDA
jgi:hypothetical protein